MKVNATSQEDPKTNETQKEPEKDVLTKIMEEVSALKVSFTQRGRGRGGSRGRFSRGNRGSSGYRGQNRGNWNNHYQGNQGSRDRDQASSSNQGHQSGNAQNQDVTCFNCNGMGHYRSECPSKRYFRGNRGGRGQSQGHQTQAVDTSQPPPPPAEYYHETSSLNY